MPSLVGAGIVLRPFLSCSIDPLLEAFKTDHVLRRFNTHSHLVTIICASEMQTMGG